MKRLHGICIFLIAGGVLALLLVLYLMPGTSEENILIEGPDTTEVVQPSGAESFAYRIVIEEDFLVVYKTSKRDAYLRTDIGVTSLPEEVLSQLEEGLVFQTEKELYDFLENYSS